MSQSATVVLQTCLVDLLESWGVTPSAVTSHSSGEIAAAYAAGALSFREALGVAYFRDDLAVKYQLSALGGGMLAVGLGRQDVERYLRQVEGGDAVVVACVNSPSSVTLSGNGVILERLTSLFEEENVFARRLRVPIAHHSWHVGIMAQEYLDALRELVSERSGSSACWGKSVVTYVSPVTGTRIALLESLRSAKHWTDNLSRPVLFHQAMEALLSVPDLGGCMRNESTTAIDVIVEIGPHSQLESVIREILGGREAKYVSCLKRNVHAVETMQEAACQLWQIGCPVDLNSVNSLDGVLRKFLSGLPSYPWCHTRKPISKPVCAQVTWEPVLVHRLNAAAKETMAIHLDDKQLKYERNVKRASYYFINDAVTKLGLHSDGRLPGEKANKEDNPSFYDWMKSVVARGKQGKLGPRSDTWQKATRGMKQKLFDELASEGPAGRILTLVGPRLANIVRGETTAAGVLEREDLADQYLEVAPMLKDRAFRHLARVVGDLAVTIPGARVLEIGHGTGAATKVVLEAFGARGDGSGTLLGRYTIADTTSKRFDEARQMLTRWSGVVDFLELDIGSDLSPSLETDAFDLVFVSHIYRDSNISPQALANIRKLLKPGSKLLMLEPIGERLDTKMLLGTAPACQNSGSDAPPAAVDQMLRRAGFSGADFDIGDCEEADIQSVRLVLSSAVAVPPSVAPHILILHLDASPGPWLVELATSVEVVTKSRPTIASLHKAESHNGILIITTSFDSSSLGSINSDDMANLKHILEKSQGVLWLSRGAFNGAGAEILESEALLSVIRAETGQGFSKRFVQLDFESSVNINRASEIGHVLQVWRETFGQTKNTLRECAYAVRGSHLQVPRVYPVLDHGEGVNSPPHLYPDATYAVVSGKGVLRNVIVSWLLDKGAKSILLVSLDTEPGQINRNFIRRASKAGCEVHAYRCDIANEKEVIELLNRVSETLPTIRGIVHAARLQHVRLPRYDIPTPASVLISADENGSRRNSSQAEILGSLNLHEHVPDVDFFVMLSPSANLHTSTFQQKLAQHRTEHNQHAAMLSFGSSSSEAAILRMLDAAISRGTPFIFDSNDDIIHREGLERCSPLGTLMLANDRIAMCSNLMAAQVKQPDHDAMLLDATTVPQVVDALRSKIGNTMGAMNVDATLPVSNYGVDSLVASELRNWVLRCTRVNVSILDIIRSPSLNDLGALLISRSAHIKG